MTRREIERIAAAVKALDGGPERIHRAEQMTRQMREVKDNLAKRLFGRSKTECAAAGTCVGCGGPVVWFKDELSRKEYSISGFCQKCQDEVFG